MMRLLLRALGSAALLCAALAACSDGSAEAPGGDAAAAGEQAAPVDPRNADPRLVELRRAIELGRLDLARTLEAQVGSLAGAERPLLQARIAVLAGDGLDALKHVETARRAAASPGALGRVHACAAETYASLGRLEAAATELEQGFAAAGPTADLLRANGIVLIVQSGGAARGLAKLEAAKDKDPATPFLDRALSQAHLLEGRRALAGGDGRAAMRHALKARDAAESSGGVDLDIKELEADCRQVLNDFEGALELLAELQAAGRDTIGTQAEVHQRAGTYELVNKNRTAALQHYAKARELGFDDDALGFGATLLAEEAGLSIARGIEAYDAGDLAGAKREFEDALAVDAHNLEALNHLAVVAFREGDYAAACDRWSAVLERAHRSGVELPEPTELNLARAQKLAGRDQAARDTVQKFLERAEGTEWEAEAREMLERL